MKTFLYILGFGNIVVGALTFPQLWFEGWLNWPGWLTFLMGCTLIYFARTEPS